jgi:2-methylisocitrate lyase-like PEP mutase family enzyme
VSHADQLRQLHDHRPLVLPNAWDAASARTFAAAGFSAIATSSGAVANVLGYEDHDGAPADEMLAAAARICRAVDLPVSVDFEAGYGLSAADLVEGLVDAGAAGCNLEDTDHATGAQRPVDEQVGWLGTVVDLAAGRLVVNARVDTYLSGTKQDDDAIARATAYLGAGADCTYPISWLDDDTTGRLAEAIPGPINVLSYPGGPAIDRLAALGVSRITFGSGLFTAALDAVEQRAKELRS